MEFDFNENLTTLRVHVATQIHGLLNCLLVCKERSFYDTFINLELEVITVFWECTELFK